ncbi:cytochrome c biogenesis protein CcsA [Marinoscillum furvescens]|uniref:Cytochrome c-type biogenesis protein CcmF n=1 Tax=Marinoscillum furvescens DSM 4134 TaxID=1122208 RepID=A0A3D9L869_MARFU|nr:cytochrome c biogenesis protein CcsA [Marinoscillum furvescens]REE01703.1 cytochrome c-type biogenesis protein CcmF [Marinoscillum furvescens DSM 4134]
MIHYFVGNLGHFLVILAFVSAVVATYAFAKNIHNTDTSWARFAKGAFYVHALAIFAIAGTLFAMISGHMFEYHYVYNYTSKILPVYYQISSFWNGQEGSFLLWMFWNAVLGLVLIHTNKSWRASMMAVFSFTQIFLVSMIMGVVIFDVKIGSSPFLLLRDVVNDPIFGIQPDYIPEDGRGLNPLLQNYWMVIHPPTLFLGFATTVIPFAYAVAGLITGRFKEWIRPALPWAQFSACVLGVGILMGAYWAYETLNFGGYWNWDPVENAVYVPWLVLVAGIHTMIAFKKSPSALKASVILILSSYILIVYSTFLTRSGVLGNSSVHSFTDLGLSGQLLIYLFVFILLAVLLCVRAWRKMPSSEEETSAYSREFWIFMGATVLCLMAFQVIIPTSIPVWNEIVELFGGSSNMAPPADQVEFYTKFQLYFAILLALLSGTGQFFWWNKMDKQKLKQALTVPVMISLLITAVIFIVAKVQDIWYLLLLTTSVYSVVANAKIFLSVAKSNIKLSGGAIAHIGVALMLIGVLFSSGYSKILSKNNTGMLWSKEFPDEVNQNNLLLFLNEPRQMEDYFMTYKGMRKLTTDYGYVDVNDIETAAGPLELIIGNETVSSDGTRLSPGDTVEIINAENSYFEVVYTQPGKGDFTLYPRVQINETMDMIVYSPDINRTLTADLYTHVRTFPDPEQEIEWSEVEEIAVAPGDQFFINDYVARFVEMVPVQQLPGVTLGPGDVAVKAIIEIEGENKTYTAEPIYVIKDKMAGRIPDVVNDLASRLTIQTIEPEQNRFVFGLSTTQKDWIIIEAVKKPWINILWLGTFLLVVGFTVAIVRRYGEFQKMRDKGME